MRVHSCIIVIKVLNRELYILLQVLLLYCVIKTNVCLHITKQSEYVLLR